MNFIDQKIESAFRKIRLGFYHALVSSSPDGFRRQSGDAEWGPTIERLRRISSPILDIIPAIGTRVAVLSQDGVPEFGAILGQMWDDSGTAQAMSAWLRAHLGDHPGHVELGATKGIRIYVGGNPVDITPGPDGTVVIDAPNIKLGAGAVKGVALGPDVEAELNALWNALSTHTHVTTATIGVGPAVGVISPPGPLGSAGTVSSTITTSE